MMHDPGYRAFYVYLALKEGHFKRKKFNFATDSLAPGQASYLWNFRPEKKVYAIIEERGYQLKQDLIDLYLPYIMYDTKFHPSTILADDFRKYRKWVKSLEPESLKIELMGTAKVITETKMSRYDFLHSENSYLIKRYRAGDLSINALLLFFKHTDWLKEEPIFSSKYERDSQKKLNFLFDKYSELVYNRVRNEKFSKAIERILSLLS
jgi:hypothetical protein